MSGLEIVLAILLCLSITAIVFLIIAIKKSFKTNDKLVEQINLFEQYYVTMAQLLTYVQTRLGYLDRTGAFAADDEIGFAYEEIKSLWKILIEAGIRTFDEKGNEKAPEESKIEFNKGEKIY